MLNNSQGEVGVPGPNGIPSDYQPITGPKKDTIHPEQYKVKGLRQIGRVLSGTRREKERQRGKLSPVLFKQSHAKKERPRHEIVHESTTIHSVK